MKKILFVINTMGQAGAETAFLDFLKKMDGSEYELSLYILMGQGEMIGKLPSNIRILNRSLSSLSVLTSQGRRKMALTVFHAFWRHGNCCGKLYSIVQSFADMAKAKRIQSSKLFWRVLSDGAQRFETEFDLAVAWLEGGAAYYVADHVNARRKAAFIHTDYKNAGYTRNMDKGCWEQFDRIFTVSEQMKGHFQAFYPECEEKVFVFNNHIDQDTLLLRAKEPGGFSDDFDGIRILTVGRLTYQKAYDVAIESMSILKKTGQKIRWYVLGEGEERKYLEKKIDALGLKEDFLLLGAVENPYPYYEQTDIYVHATRLEGKSIAIQEAQALGCAVIASDCCGNRELITDGEDGILCRLIPQNIAESIIKVLGDKEMRERMGRMAKAKKAPEGQEKFLKELLDPKGTP